MRSISTRRQGEGAGSEGAASPWQDREVCRAALPRERRQEVTNAFKAKEESYLVMPGIRRVINAVAVIHSRSCGPGGDERSDAEPPRRGVHSLKWKAQNYEFRRTLVFYIIDLLGYTLRVYMLSYAKNASAAPLVQHYNLSGRKSSGLVSG